MNIKSTLLVLSLMLLPASNALAQEEPVPAVDVPTEAAEMAGPVTVNNKICPVSGKEVGSMGEGLEVEYNGRIYKLCCPGCLSDFNNDPEKYSKIADDMAAIDVPAEAVEGDVQGYDGQEGAAIDTPQE